MVKGGIIVAAVLVQQFRFKSLTQFLEPQGPPQPDHRPPPVRRRRRPADAPPDSPTGGR